MRFSLTEKIGLPAADTLSLISDLERSLPKIDPDMLEVTKLTEGEIGVGTEWEERFTGPLRRVTVVRSRVEELRPSEFLRLHFETAGLKGEITFECVALSPDKTSLTLTMDASPTLFGWLAYPLSRRDVRMRETVRLRNFKRLAESGNL